MMCAERSRSSIERCSENEALFRNAVTTATTLMILALLGFIGWSGLGPRSYSVLGTQKCASACFWTCGLLLCGGAGRTGQDHSARHRRKLRTGTVSTGQHSHHRRCVGALLIIIAAIATPIAKTQHAREIWFYMMSGGAVLKIVTMEIARIIL